MSYVATWPSKRKIRRTGLPLSRGSRLDSSSYTAFRHPVSQEHSPNPVYRSRKSSRVTPAGVAHQSGRGASRTRTGCSVPWPAYLRWFFGLHGLDAAPL